MMRKTAAAATVAALVLGAGACGKDDSDASKPEKTSAQSAGTKFTTDGSTPDDFPSAVPLPDGKVTASRAGTQTGGRSGWTVVTKVDGTVPAAFRSAQSALTDKKFEATGKPSKVRNQVAQRSYSNGTYQVSLTVSQVSKSASLVSTQVIGAQS